MLMCASSFSPHPMTFVPPVVSLYRARNMNVNLRVPSVLSLTPTGAPTLLQGFPLSKSQVHCSIDGSNPRSEASVNPTKLLGFPPLRGHKIAGTADGTTPIRK